VDARKCVSGAACDTAAVQTSNRVQAVVGVWIFFFRKILRQGAYYDADECVVEQVAECVHLLSSSHCHVVLVNCDVLHAQMLVQIRSSNGGARGTHANSELKVVFEIIQNYGHALRYGHSHIFQSLPRLLTLWFEAASMISSSTRAGKDLYRRMVDLARDLPAYQWLTALPQLISRISHNSSSVYKVLAAVLVKIVKAFPSQSLWTIIGASETANVARKARFREILTQAKKNKQRLSEQVCCIPNVKYGIMVRRARLYCLFCVCSYQINVAQRLVRTLNDIAKETQGVTHKAPYDVKRLQEIPVRGHNILMPLQSALTPHLPAMDLGTQSNPSSNGKSTFLDSTQV